MSNHRCDVTFCGDASYCANIKPKIFATEPGVLPDMDLHEPFFHAIRDRAVDIMHQDGEGSDRDARFARTKRIKSDMCRTSTTLSARDNHLGRFSGR
jgi:hypothetical protein